MPDNLHLYHKILHQICQWLPQERITRLRNLALFMTGLYLGGTVHLSLIVRKWLLPGRLPSLVNRLHRFLDNPQVLVQAWYRPLAQHLLAALAGQPLYLVIDCTQVGFHHRLLMVGVTYRKRVLPLAWSVHRGVKGHVTAQEQITLLQSVQELLPRGCEVWLLGDSGFQAVPLLRWLRRQGWHFVIRQSGQRQVRWQGGGWIKLGHLPLSPGEHRVICWVRLTAGHDFGWVWLVLHWQQGEKEPWYLVSDQPDSRQMLRLYRKRMWTEETYGDLKGHGFDLEHTHLCHGERISRLLLGVCLVYVWLLILGSWVVKRGYRSQIDRKSRRDKSYFRLGWDWLEHCFRLGKDVQLRFSPYP